MIIWEFLIDVKANLFCFFLFFLELSFLNRGKKRGEAHTVLFLQVSVVIILYHISLDFYNILYDITYLQKDITFKRRTYGMI